MRIFISVSFCRNLAVFRAVSWEDLPAGEVIDEVIDKIIDNISLWYFTPEIQFRPLIVSLWGITGVGKTDLVRTLVNLLNFTDKFIEIQMDIKTDYVRNIETYLENSGIETNEPAILLLDEIQRYRTLDENGKMLDNLSFNDIWMLLSDGKFQNNSKRRAELFESLMEEMYYQDCRISDEPAKPKTKKEEALEMKRKFRTSFWSANRFKKMLNISTSVEDIMKMSLQDRMELMEETLKKGEVNTGKSYEKLLIFISGNLDEAFKMSDDVEDTEKDADIYHELSKRINIIHIKSALATKFKPEQIARFGNNHIIYPCLDKQSFYKIIKMNCKAILDRIEKEHNMKITLSNNIYDVIYRNGVFPAQGVRPVISTVFNVLGSNLPHFIYHALVNDVTAINLDFENNFLISQMNDNLIKKEIILDIDNIKKNKSIDEKILVIVHELGHALVYALLFNTPPKQININSSGISAGFVINHGSVDNKTFIKNQIAVFLAGLVAEELVFGEEFRSNGSTADIISATDAAGRYVRSYAMDGTISRIEKAVHPMLQFNYDIDKTNDIIENLLIEQKKISRDLLNKHMNIFKELIDHTVKNNSISNEKFIEICNLNNLKIEQKEINDKLIYSYENKLNDFLN